MKDKIINFLIIIFTIITTTFCNICSFKSGVDINSQYDHISTENVSEEILKKDIKPKNAQNAELKDFNVTESGIYLGSFGTTTFYTITYDYDINFVFEQYFIWNDELDFGLQYLFLKEIHTTFAFWKLNNTNNTTEFIGGASGTKFINIYKPDGDYNLNKLTVFDYITLNFNFNRTVENNIVDYTVDYTYELVLTPDNEDEEETINEFSGDLDINLNNNYYITYLESHYHSFDYLMYMELFVDGDVQGVWYNYGYKDGFDEGKIEGINIGKNLVDSTNNTLGFVWSTITNAVNSIFNLFSIDILPGIPLYMLIALPLIVSLFLFILKVIRK